MELIDISTFFTELVEALDIPAEVIEDMTEEMQRFINDRPASQTDGHFLT